MAYTKSNTTNVSFTAASTSQVLSTKAKEVILSATADCYVSFDSTLVTASNGFYVAKDKQYTIHILFPAQIAVIRKSADGSLSVLELGDSSKELKVTYSATFTGDTNLIGSIQTTFTGDASLKTEISSSWNGDAFISITQLRTFTGDANLKREYEFTGDASLKKTIATTFTGDANLVETIHSLCFNSDAKLVTF